MTTPPVPPANAPPCARDDVSASFDGHNGATGHEIDYIRFRNVGRSTCLLAGYPHVVASQSGRPAVTATDGSYFPDGHAANLHPGGAAMLGVETDSDCAARPGDAGGGEIYKHLAITLPSGGTVSLTMPRSDELDVTCGLHLTHFFDPRYPQPEPVDPLWDLRAALEPPSASKDGSAIQFIVDLRNPTGHRVLLRPCPGYVEAATMATQDSPPETLSKLTYALNCASVRAFNAQQAVRFSMRLSVPTPVPAGRVRVCWSLILSKALACRPVDFTK